MDREAVIARTEAHVRERLGGEATGHDWWHAHRVRQLALRIGREEGADPYVIELAALLHDLADWKFHAGDEEAGGRQVVAWLGELGVDPDVVEHVREIARDLSYKGAGVATPMRTIEGAVVQDADRLDAIGAIGIARAFAYGGARGRALHDPDVPSQLHGTAAEYKANTGPTTNHFPEKLFLLKDRMNTAAARRIAEERHRFMERFLDTFFAEWEGRA